MYTVYLVLRQQGWAEHSCGLASLTSRGGALPPPPPNLPCSEENLLCSLIVKASVTIFLPTGGEAEWNVQNWSFKQHCKGRIFARVPDRRVVTGT